MQVSVLLVVVIPAISGFGFGEQQAASGYNAGGYSGGGGGYAGGGGKSTSYSSY